MSVTVQEISIAARAGLAAVTAETAGYFVLAATDQLESASGRLGSVHLGEDGSVNIGRLEDGSAEDLESDLRALLSQLLGSTSSRAAALTRAAQPASARGMSRFASELESALIPVNRAAARRALSRLHRDAARAKAAGKLNPPRVEAPRLPDPPVETSPRPSPPAVVALAEPVVLAAPLPTAAPDLIGPDVRPPEPPAGPDLPEVPAPMFQLARTPILPDVAWIARGADATPFLGSWGAVASVPSVLFPAQEPGELDTERQPPVSFETSDDLTPIPAEPAAIAPAEPVITLPAVAAPTLVVTVEPSPIAALPFAVIAESPPVLTESPPIAIAESPGVAIAELAFVATVELAFIVNAEPAPIAHPESAVAVLAEPEPESVVTVLAEPEPEPAVTVLAEPEPEFERDEDDAFGAAVIHALQDEQDAPAESGPVPPEPVGVEATPAASLEAPVEVAPVEVAAEAAPVDAVESDGAPESTPMQVGPVEEAAVVVDDVESLAAPIVAPAPAAPAPEPKYAVYQPRKSDVADLVAGFVVAESRSLAELSRDLKRMAGVGTPCPPAVALDTGSRKPSLAR